MYYKLKSNPFPSEPQTDTSYCPIQADLTCARKCTSSLMEESPSPLNPNPKSTAEEVITGSGILRKKFDCKYHRQDILMTPPPKKSRKRDLNIFVPLTFSRADFIDKQVTT